MAYNPKKPEIVKKKEIQFRRPELDLPVGKSR